MYEFKNGFQGRAFCSFGSKSRNITDIRSKECAILHTLTHDYAKSRGTVSVLIT